MPITAYGTQKVLDSLLGANRSTQMPATIYIGLFTTNPGFDGTGGVEVSFISTNYARVPYTNNSTNWPNATLGTPYKLNGTTVSFNTASANWGTVVGFGFFDATTSGNLFWAGPVGTPTAVNSGSAPLFNVGSMGLQIGSV